MSWLANSCNRVGQLSLNCFRRLSLDGFNKPEREYLEDTVVLKNVPYDCRDSDIEAFIQPLHAERINLVKRFGVFAGTVIVKFADINDANTLLNREPGQINLKALTVEIGENNIFNHIK
ncbi:hypothetical protein MXB_959 [Myxobolus squamalis]|nr:hypothetical protein MXB_959 [Myxobolus squamalis]